MSNGITRYVTLSTREEGVFTIEEHPKGEYVLFDDYDDLYVKYRDLCEKITDLWRDV